MPKCPVCGQEFSFQQYGGRLQTNAQLGSHLFQNHPDYMRFNRRFNYLITPPGVVLLSGIFLTPRSSLFGITLVPVGVIGIIVALLYRSRKITGYKRDWKQKSSSLIPQVESAIIPPATASSGPFAGDASILLTANQVANSLGFSNYDLTGITWLDYILMPRGGSIRVELDKPLVGRRKMTLPLRIQNQLSMDEWRPLFSSMMITRAWQRRRLLWSVLLVVVIAVAVYFLVIFLARPPPGSEASIGFFSAVGSFVFVGFVLSPLLRRELLHADLQTAQMFGTTNFVQVLQKLETLNQSLSEPGSSPFKKPTIQQRIQNLQISATK